MGGVVTEVIEDALWMIFYDIEAIRRSNVRSVTFRPCFTASLALKL